MKSVLIDSDIMLDLVLKRFPFYEWALGLFLSLDRRECLGFVTVHSLLNVHYFARKKFDEKDARTAIKLLTQRLKVISEDEFVVDEALTSPFADFEDAVQYFAAVEAKVDIIITRNIKDYKHATIPVITPERFLKTL